MNSMFAIIPVTAAAYVATNLDNFILLVALLGRYRQHTANVVAGFFACTLLIALLALWIGMAANFVPVRFLGFLGFVPVAADSAYKGPLCQERDRRSERKSG
jgi:cadmium resistance protein CadD (predicted permease)